MWWFLGCGFIGDIVVVVVGCSLFCSFGCKSSLLVSSRVFSTTWGNFLGWFGVGYATDFLSRLVGFDWWWFFPSNTGVIGIGIGSGCILSFDLVTRLRSLSPVFVFALWTGGLPLSLDYTLSEWCDLSMDLDASRDSDSDYVACFTRDRFVWSPRISLSPIWFFCFVYFWFFISDRLPYIRCLLAALFWLCLFCTCICTFTPLITTSSTKCSTAAWRCTTTTTTCTQSLDYNVLHLPSWHWVFDGRVLSFHHLSNFVCADHCLWSWLGIGRCAYELRRCRSWWLTWLSSIYCKL